MAQPICGAEAWVCVSVSFRRLPKRQWLWHFAGNCPGGTIHYRLSEDKTNQPSDPQTLVLPLMTVCRSAQS